MSEFWEYHLNATEKQYLTFMGCLYGVVSFPVLPLVAISFFLLTHFSKVSAAITSSGDLKFLSEPTLSDTDPETTDAK